jgi:hypothetical protein
MFVVTLDQKGSRRDGDRIPELLEQLKPVRALVPFTRTVGDEAQGVLDLPESVVDIVLLALRSGGWHVGVGVGDVETPLPREAREGRGGAFVAARAAVERAKKSGDRAPIAVESQQEPRREEGAASAQAAAHAEAVLMLVGRAVMNRSDAEWRIVDLLQPGVRGTQTAAARELGVSPQAVSKAVARAVWVEEQAARPAAAALLAWADERPGPGANGGKA